MNPKHTRKRATKPAPQQAADEVVLIACPDCRIKSRFGKGRIGEQRHCPVCNKTVSAVLDRTHNAFDWWAPGVPPEVRARGDAILQAIVRGIISGGISRA